VVAELQSRQLTPTLVVRSDRAGEFSHLPRITMDLHRPDPASLQQLASCDVLLHLAWGGLPHYRSLHHFESELPAHYRFLKAALGAGLKRLLVAGTCSEYGLQSGALCEDMACVPVHAYALAKDSLRQQLVHLQREIPFAFTWARIFYLHGPGQAENSVLSQLQRAVERGDARFNMSGGEQLRDYLSVQQAAHLLVSLALLSQEAGLVNLCSGQPISIRRLVEEWLAREQRSIELNLGHYPYPDYEPMAFWGDATRLRRCLAADRDLSPHPRTAPTP
jgi:dTDP-6-deoxy-L-talose 4-dehydrogenase (NAD+)